MRSIEELLDANLLPVGAAEVFSNSRVRVSQRHANWRVNFPAIGALLDSDEDRAQALAGNYATEAREIVGVWLSAQESDASAQAPIDERVAWVVEFWRSWRAQVLAGADYGALDDAPRERFLEMFDDLCTRFRDDAVGWLRDGGGANAAPGSAWRRLTAPLRVLARGLEGFFFPSVRR